MKKKNSYIEAMRFIFIMVLLLHHTGSYGLSEYISNCPGGYIVVEFFYILMGAFTMAHIEKNRDKMTQPMGYGIQYTIGKLKRLFPYATVGTLGCYIWYIVRNHSGFDGLKSYFWFFTNMLYETFFLSFSGAFVGQTSDFKNAPMWFLSAMFMTLPIIIFLAVKAEDFFKHYFVWFAPLLIYGWMIRSWGDFALWSDYKGFLYGGVVRAFADITMGCGAYLVGEQIKKIGKYRALWTLLELAVLCMVVYACTLWPNNYHLVTIIICMALGIGISMSGISYTAVDNKLLDYLGGLAMPIYCLHWCVMTIVADLMVERSVDEKIGVYVFTTILLAVLMQALVKAIGKNKKMSNT